MNGPRCLSTFPPRRGICLSHVAPFFCNETSKFKNHPSWGLHCKPILPLDGVLLPLGGSVAGEMSKQPELRPLITWQLTRRNSFPLKGFEFTSKLNL